jgi:hypothetical protein
MALIQNGATMPKPEIVTPPSAGPSAREIFTPTLLAAIAADKSSLGTSCGTTDCQAGTVSAPAAPTRNVNSNRFPGVAQPSPTITAKIAETTVVSISTIIRNLRLSKISASAPAGIANRQIGKVSAVCTSATMKGSGLRLVMSQPEAALYIQPPTLETSVAVQITANAEWRNGAAKDTGLTEVALVVVLIADSSKQNEKKIIFIHWRGSKAGAAPDAYGDASAAATEGAVSLKRLALFRLEREGAPFRDAYCVRICGEGQ